MSDFSLSLDQRIKLWMAGWGEIDSALRFAAVELDLWFLGPRFHWGEASDGEQRHFTNFLAWADTTLVGINKLVNLPGDQALLRRWEALRDVPIRRQMNELRNVALKRRQDVAPWTPVFRSRGGIALRPVFQGGGSDMPVYGTGQDYLRWICESALPIADDAMRLGAVGPNPIDPDLPVADQMPFPETDPWTTRCEPEFRHLLES